jgi:hypothetical protein
MSENPPASSSDLELVHDSGGAASEIWLRGGCSGGGAVEPEGGLGFGAGASLGTPGPFPVPFWTKSAGIGVLGIARCVGRGGGGLLEPGRQNSERVLQGERQVSGTAFEGGVLLAAGSSTFGGA